MGVLAKLVHGGDFEPRTAEKSNSVREFLAASGLSHDIQKDLCEATSERDAQICWGAFTVIASEQLKSLNLDALYRPWFDDGYFTVASGPCGDPICIDVRSNRMGYILHEEMDHLRPGLVPSHHVIHTPLSYNQFWQRILDNEGVPCDADQAEEKWGRPRRCIA